MRNELNNPARKQKQTKTPVKVYRITDLVSSTSQCHETKKRERRTSPDKGFNEETQNQMQCLGLTGIMMQNRPTVKRCFQNK